MQGYLLRRMDAFLFSAWKGGSGHSYHPGDLCYLQGQTTPESLGLLCLSQTPPPPSPRTLPLALFLCQQNPSLGNLFQVLCVKPFSFMRSRLLNIDLSALVIGLRFRKLSSVPMHSKLFSTFSSIRFSGSDFMLRYLIHLELCFVMYDRYRTIHILQFSRPASFVEDVFFLFSIL